MTATVSTPTSVLRDVPATAEYLNVNIHFVRRLVRDRKIPYVKLGKLVRFDTNDLDAYMKAGRVEPILS